MSAAAILADCRAAGVRLTAQGERIKVSAEHPPSPALLDALRIHKADVLALLLRGAAKDASSPAIPASDYSREPDPDAMVEDFTERAAIIHEGSGLPDTPQGWRDADLLAWKEVFCSCCANAGRTCCRLALLPLNCGAWTYGKE